MDLNNHNQLHSLGKPSVTDYSNGLEVEARDPRTISEGSNQKERTKKKRKFVVKPKDKIINKNGPILIGIKRKREEVEDPVNEITLGYDKSGKINYKRVVTESEQLLNDFDSLNISKPSENDSKVRKALSNSILERGNTSC